MNILYKILYPGSYIPWCILTLHYVSQYNVFRSFYCIGILLLAAAKLSHMEHFHITVIEWSQLLTMFEMCLFLRYIICNTLDSKFIAITSTVILFSLFVRCGRNKKSFFVQERFYSILILFLCSTSTMTYFQSTLCAALAALVLYEWNTDVRNYESLEQMRPLVKNYFHRKIARVYILFMIEYSTSKLRPSSLCIIIAVAFAFQLYAYMSIDITNNKLDDFYYNICNLPREYPIPLDFTHAREHCNIAKQVFKSHDL